MSDTIELRAYRGPTGVFLAWWHPTKIAECLGYAVLRRVHRTDVTPLPAYVAFADNRAPVQANQEGQPSTIWPYQRFTWTDYHPPEDDVVEYRVVCMMGTPEFPRQSGLLSSWVEAHRPRFSNLTPYFNFGIVGSRWFSTMAAEHPEQFEALRKALVPALKGTKTNHGRPANVRQKPRPAHAGTTADQALDEVLKLPVKEGEPGTIGEALGGPLAAKMAAMLSEAQTNKDIEIYASLFELSEPQLIAQLKELRQRCHLILANGTHQHHSDENRAAAFALDGAIDLSRRMLERESVYAHNKFVVFTESGNPVRVWTGSTNWSPHGVYTQVNNGLMLDDADVAKAYFAEWHRLKRAGEKSPPPPDGEAQEQYHFRKSGAAISVFFSPHRVPKGEGATSPDLSYASALIRGARQGILTLMLDPGWEGSLLQAIRRIAESNRALYVRGLVNSDPTIHAKQGDTDTVGFLHGHEAIPSTYDIALPTAQRQPNEPIEDYLGRVGIVVVHSKVIVIDPLGDHPVVMTGSHNMGVKAATVNDDNLVIIENDRDVALAYAVNVISTFNHFWWRHNMAPPKERKAVRDKHEGRLSGTVTQHPTSEWKGLHPDDTWQDKFYRDPTEANEARFWGLPVQQN
jgi:phosphatidylserine/phosphatidylglycerophosphate/cardiolipin synthase-like enzyme